MFEHLARVIERVADERLRVYLYHIPPQAVLGFSIELVGRFIEAYPDTVVGLKDSSGDWSYTAALLSEYPGFRVLSGSETFLLDNLRHGGGGCITATGNVNARRIRAVYDAFTSGSGAEAGPGAETGGGEPAAGRADDLQAGITTMRKCIQSQPMIPTLKHLVAHYRDDPGWMAVRPPFQALPTAAGRDVRQTLERTHGFAPAFPRAPVPARVA